jgi:hypothetical protein
MEGMTMATLIREIEAIGAAVPPLAASAANVSAATAEALWPRLERHVRFRWTARNVTWIVEGPGDFEAPLSPATVSTVERWSGVVWETVTAPASALGGWHLGTEGPWRFTASVGGGTVPQDVLEAFKRLCAYSKEIGDYGLVKGRAGATGNNVKIGSGVDQSFDRPATWAARALVNSGAAELLRPYRRA